MCATPNRPSLTYTPNPILFNPNLNVLNMCGSVSNLLRSTQANTMLSIVGKRRPRVYKARAPMRKKSRYSRARLGNPAYQLAGVGFPSSLTCNIRYNDTFLLTGSGATAGRQIMSLNNLHDPDVTGFGHQPIAYDQFAGLYQNFVVLGARIDVVFSPNTIANSIPAAGPFLVGISGNTNNSFSTTASDLVEQPRAVTTLIGREVGSSVNSLALTYTPKACLGVGVGDDTVTGNTNGTAPSKQFFACVWSSDRNSQGGAVYATVTVTYKARFFNLKNITPS